MLGFNIVIYANSNMVLEFVRIIIGLHILSGSKPIALGVTGALEVTLIVVTPSMP